MRVILSVAIEVSTCIEVETAEEHPNGSLVGTTIVRVRIILCLRIEHVSLSSSEFVYKPVEHKLPAKFQKLSTCVLLSLFEIRIVGMSLLRTFRRDFLGESRVSEEIKHEEIVVCTNEAHLCKHCLVFCNFQEVITESDV